ncbi:MAG TPA: FAD-binding protein [Anaerolineales bacterium]|nr:FAD-binding protein [Anaerolineales bacterium]
MSSRTTTLADRLVYGLEDMVHRLENMGVDFRDPDKPDVPFYHHRAFGLPGEYRINFDGVDFKHIIGREARKTGARGLERVLVADILIESGRPRGALAFNIRRGTIYFILARAVILAWGSGLRSTFTTSAARSTSMMGLAIMHGAAIMKEKLIQAAVRLLEVVPEQLSAGEGVVYVISQTG